MTDQAEEIKRLRDKLYEESVASDRRITACMNVYEHRIERLTAERNAWCKLVMEHNANCMRTYKGDGTGAIPLYLEHPLIIIPPELEQSP